MLARAAHVLYLSRRRIATAAVVVIAIFIGYHAIFGENGAVAYQKKCAEYRSLQNDVQQLQSEQDKLSQEIHSLKTDRSAIEKEAREQLHYAKPDEVIYVAPYPEHSAPPAANSAQK